MTRLGFTRENTGRIVLISATILMWLFLLLMFKNYGYNKTWQLWGVQTEELPFMDFRLIPSSAESFRNGFEPTVENPFEPGGRIFNYPAFWRLFFYVNFISQDDTIWICIVMLILFFTGIFLFPQRLSVTSAFWMLLIVFSPASMLLYERGNVDLFVFFICALIILAADYSTNLTMGLLIFGAIVKIFPFFGITVLFRESKRRFFLFSAVGVMILLIYGFITWESQRAAWTTTWRGEMMSYGTFVLLTRFASYFQSPLWKVAFEGLGLLLIFIGVIPAIRNSQSLPVASERNLTAFRMGASIYMGTFLLGNNWDYRLAFLIFVIPQLSEWFYAENKTHRHIAMGMMLAITLSCWHFVFLIDLPFIPFKNR
ncbi:MAG: hypothetical protein IPP66_22220 [Anaerolineales bacterium]|nr:hypothetical protein [Anaerolineales bacterium]